MDYKKYKNIAKKPVDRQVEKSIDTFSLGELLKDTQATNKIAVTKGNALSNSDIIFSCVNYIASTISMMPISLYKSTTGGKEKVDNELNYLVHNRPNQMMNSVDFIQTLVSNMYLHGNSYAYIVTKRGIANELVILEPSVTTLEKVDNKYVVKTTINDVAMVLDYKSVIHIRDLSNNGINGISRLDSIIAKASNKANSDKKLSDYMENGGIKGILTVPSTQSKSKKKVKDRFNKSISDGVAVLEDGFNFNSVPNMSMADAEFLNNLKLTKEDIISIFNINPALIGMNSGSATNSNMLVMVQEFVKSLIPLIRKIEQELNYKLLSETDRKNHYFKLNMEVALRGSQTERIDNYVKMLTNGIINRNEVRAMEDWNDVELGDEYYRSLNYINIKTADEYQLSKSGAGETAE